MIVALCLADFPKVPSGNLFSLEAQNFGLAWADSSLLTFVIPHAQSRALCSPCPGIQEAGFPEYIPQHTMYRVLPMERDLVVIFLWPRSAS